MESTSIDLNFFQQELKGFVYKRVRDKALTEDIVHDVFLKVQSKRGQLQAQEKIASWIYQITQNTIMDHFRKQSRMVNAADLDWSDDVPNFNECVAGYIKRVIPTLPEKYRVALVLTEFENLSQLELAKRLGISYSGAKSRVQRARMLLKKKVDEALILKTDGYGNAIVCVDRGHCC